MLIEEVVLKEINPACPSESASGGVGGFNGSF